jgi:hypothetical protein
VQNKETGQRARHSLGALFAAAAVSALTGCGGGGSSSDSGSVAWTPSAAVLAAKRADSPLRFNHAGRLSAGQGCFDALANTTVYEQAHTVVFAAAGVTEADQQEVADYAEAAAIEVRSRLAARAAVGIGGLGRKAHICVQTQRVNSGSAPASAFGVTNSNSEGNIVIQSPAEFFATFPRASMADDSLTQQAFYARILVHEAAHLIEFLRVNMALDQWMTEGLARYIEVGKQSVSKDRLIGFFAAQNPINIAWPASDAREKLGDYSPAGSVMAYLFSPTGANNSLATFIALLDRINADSASYLAGCRANGFTTPACTGVGREAQRSAFFVAAFEATFKERDGTPMKLRTGANNLQDTIVARITAWW